MGKRDAIGLEQYAHIASAVVGADPACIDSILAEEGISRPVFDSANTQWSRRLASGDEGLLRRYGELFRNALAERAGEGPSLSFDDFVAARVDEETRGNIAAWAAGRRLSVPLVALRMLEWRQRCESDRRLGALHELRVQLAKSRVSSLRKLPVPRMARLVFPRACPRCGAHKRTEPRTAYVYCDYCAFLFDYDFERGMPASDVPVFDTLVDAVRDDLRSQFASQEWGAYRRTWRWVYSMDIELAPEGWSPRVAEATYREAMLEFSVETCVLRNTSPVLKGKADRVDGACLAAAMAPSREALLNLFHVQQGEVEREIQVYDAEGLWARHPDELDPSTYRHIATVQILQQLLTNADPVARKAMIAAADIRREAVELEPVSAEPTTCGWCGGQLLVVAGSKKLLCEGCGNVLDAGATRFPCTQCGAPVIVVAGREVRCAYCATVFVPSV